MGQSVSSLGEPVFRGAICTFFGRCSDCVPYERSYCDSAGWEYRAHIETIRLFAQNTSLRAGAGRCARDPSCHAQTNESFLSGGAGIEDILNGEILFLDKLYLRIGLERIRGGMDTQKFYSDFERIVASEKKLKEIIS